MSIPIHTPDGILPPFTGADPTTSVRLSPYEVSALQLVSRFATSPVRIQILEGWLEYRAELRAFGLTDGFQWIDGSFVEKLDRDPGDVDLVTFASRPEAYDLGGRYLFDPFETRRRFFCDAYFVDLRRKNPAKLIERVAYYYGLFSHRRGSLA